MTDPDPPAAEGPVPDRPPPRREPPPWWRLTRQILALGEVVAATRNETAFILLIAGLKAARLTGDLLTSRGKQQEISD